MNCLDGWFMKSEEIMSNDKKGNYDIDGVSSDGDDVYLGGDNQSVYEPVQRPLKKDRKKNLSYSREQKKEEQEWVIFLIIWEKNMQEWEIFKNSQW